MTDTIIKRGSLDADKHRKKIGILKYRSYAALSQGTPGPTEVRKVICTDIPSQLSEGANSANSLLSAF